MVRYPRNYGDKIISVACCSVPLFIIPATLEVPTSKARRRTRPHRQINSPQGPNLIASTCTAPSRPLLCSCRHLPLLHGGPSSASALHQWHNKRQVLDMAQAPNWGHGFSANVGQPSRISITMGIFVRRKTSLCDHSQLSRFNFKRMIMHH